jgi:hypothetical protein
MSFGLERTVPDLVQGVTLGAVNTGVVAGAFDLAGARPGDAADLITSIVTRTHDDAVRVL